MKEISWQKVIVSWANALHLGKEPVLDISDLLDGHFFIGVLQQLGEQVQLDSNKNIKLIIDTFIADNYNGVKMKCVWDNKELTLISSLLLLTSLLEVSHLRVPLYTLNNDIQLNIQCFIQRFLNFPKVLITREIIIEAIENIETVRDEKEVDESSSFVSSSSSSFCTNSDSPDMKGITLKKVKLLQNQVDVLNLDKLHLQEELEINKEDLMQLDSKNKAKELEILHLKNELFVLKNSSNADEEKILTDKYLIQSELNLVKDDLTLLQATLCLTRSELEAAVIDNQLFKDKLEKEGHEKRKFQKQSELSVTKLANMTAIMEQMQSKLTFLNNICHEQEEMLRDRGTSKILEESFVNTDENLMTTIGTGESLASVIDIKYAELELETKKLREKLDNSEAMVVSLKELFADQEKSKEDASKEKESAGNVHIKCTQSQLTDAATQTKDLELKEDLTKLSGDFHAIDNKDFHLKRYDNEDEREEICRLIEIIDGKTIRLEECIKLSEKLRGDLNAKEVELKTTTQSLKTLLNENERQKTVLTLQEAELEDLNCQLDICESRLAEKDDRMAALTADIGERACEAEQLREQILEFEEKFSAEQLIMKNKDVELNEVKKSVEKSKTELDYLKNELCAKACSVAELKHDVQMCQHEKSVLEKRMEHIIKDLQKNESSLKKELIKCEEEKIHLKKELEMEKANMKIVQDQVELEDKLNNAFDIKLTELQAKMKSQYEKELSGTVEEYKDKINQLKLKITKDKLHIQELSADLWNTTDKLLLSQQQCEALRNQLRRTKCALEILSNSNVRRHSLATSAAIQRASNPCLWLQAEDFNSHIVPTTIIDEPLIKSRQKGVVWSAINIHSDSPEVDHQCRRFSLVLESSPSNQFNCDIYEQEGHQELEEDEEIFNDAFLQDLKDGICRIPNVNNNIQRASCPPVAKLPESPLLQGEKISDKQVLIPPEKPKRKGQIAYSKPGPPTPCKTAGTRLSLQNFERLDQRKLKENNGIIPSLTHQSLSGPRRLSKLFTSAKGQNKTKPFSQDSPKVKRKNFFQRRFCSNRENLAP